MSFDVPKKLERQINRLVKNYPEKRSAALMVLHALQEEFGHISVEAEQWAAAKLNLQPINIHELVTFTRCCASTTRARRWCGFAEL